jgi:mercuric ion binding protein
MKAIILVAALFGLAFSPAYAQTWKSGQAGKSDQSGKSDQAGKSDQHVTTDHIKVFGECESCKRRIENSLKIDGIISASWNVDTKVLTVEYDDKRLNTDKIEQLLSSAGHDTEKFRATDKAYNALPACCHYTRPKS